MKNKVNLDILKNLNESGLQFEVGFENNNFICLKTIMIFCLGGIILTIKHNNLAFIV